MKFDNIDIEYTLPTSRLAASASVAGIIFDGKNPFWELDGEAGDTPSKLINAIEIDWNGAELNLPDALGGTKHISTTGELLKERLQYNSPMFARVA